MYLVIDLNNGIAKRFRDLTEQQIQALIDCEEYLILKIEPAQAGVELYANSIDEDSNEEKIEEGRIEQNNSIIQVR